MQTLAVRYRPQKFSQVLGQDDSKWVLRAFIVKDRKGESFPNALLLTGPSGTGKTTLARIISRALLCDEPVKGEPCLSCDSCKESLRNRHPAVLEVDAARYSGVDDTKELIASLNRAHPFRKQVLIMDECHAFSRQAWDALLRTIENGLEDCIFIFCTTSSEKLRPEVQSRLFRFDIHTPAPSEIAKRLVAASGRGNFTLSLEDAYEIAHRCKGNVRSAFNLLQKVMASPDRGVKTLLGFGSFGVDLLETALKRDRTGGILLLEAAWEHFGNVSDVYQEWMQALESLLLVNYGLDDQVDNPVLVMRLKELSAGYSENLLAACMECVTDWARRGGGRINLSFAWTTFFRIIHGSTTIDHVKSSKEQKVKASLDDIRSFSL